MVAQVNPYGVIRRVLIAAVTGVLPEEHRLDAIHLLTEALRAPDEDLRGLAVIGLNEIGKPYERVLPALAHALSDPSELVRKRAARALGDNAEFATPYLSALTAALGDGDESVRMEAVNAIGRIGPEAEGALPGLVCLLAEPETRTQTIVQTAMRRIGEPSIPYLLALFADHDPLLRLRAIQLIGRIGISNDDVIAGLLEACSDPIAEVRHTARGVIDNFEMASI
jgi:HEAT repeat protein